MNGRVSAVVDDASVAPGSGLVSLAATGRHGNLDLRRADKRHAPAADTTFGAVYQQHYPAPMTLRPADTAASYIESRVLREYLPLPSLLDRRRSAIYTIRPNITYDCHC